MDAAAAAAVPEDTGGLVRHPDLDFQRSFFHAAPRERPRLPLAACVDAASLYPSEMHDYRLCFSTVTTVARARRLGLPHEVLADEALGGPNGEPARRVCFEPPETANHEPGPPRAPVAYEVFWRSPDGAETHCRAPLRDGTLCVCRCQRGTVLPDAMLDLKRRRSAVKKRMKALKKEREAAAGDQARRDALAAQIEAADAEQLGVKVLMNSTYGLLRPAHSPIRSVACAHAIPMVGRRENLRWSRMGYRMSETNAWPVKGRRYRTLYGDTDSIFFYFSEWETEPDLKEMCESNEGFASFCNEQLYGDCAMMELEAEYVLTVYYLQKKRYVFLPFDPASGRMTQLDRRPEHVDYFGDADDCLALRNRPDEHLVALPSEPRADAFRAVWRDDPIPGSGEVRVDTLEELVLLGFGHHLRRPPRVNEKGMDRRGVTPAESRLRGVMGQAAWFRRPPPGGTRIGALAGALVSYLDRLASDLTPTTDFCMSASLKSSPGEGWRAYLAGGKPPGSFAVDTAGLRCAKAVALTSPGGAAAASEDGAELAGKRWLYFVGDTWTPREKVMDHIVPLEISDRMRTRPSLAYIATQRIWPQVQKFLEAFGVPPEQATSCGIARIFFGEDPRERARVRALLTNFLPPVVPAMQVRGWKRRVAPQYGPWLEGIAAAHPGGVPAATLRGLARGVPEEPRSGRGDAALRTLYPRRAAGLRDLRAACRRERAACLSCRGEQRAPLEALRAAGPTVVLPGQALVLAKPNGPALPCTIELTAEPEGDAGLLLIVEDPGGAGWTVGTEARQGVRIVRGEAVWTPDEARTADIEDFPECDNRLCGRYWNRRTYAEKRDRAEADALMG